MKYELCQFAGDPLLPDGPRWSEVVNASAEGPLEVFFLVLRFKSGHFCGLCESGSLSVCRPGKAGHSAIRLLIMSCCCWRLASQVRSDM